MHNKILNKVCVVIIITKGDKNDISVLEKSRVVIEISIERNEI